MEQALFGLLGLFIGIALNEYFRRRSRVELYSAKIFEKRLEIYEGLMTLVTDAGSEVNELLDAAPISLAEANERIGVLGFRVFEYLDRHSLYINEDVAVQCGATFIEISNIFDIEKGEKRDNAISAYQAMLRDAKKMIREESGMPEIDRAFRAVSRAKHSSPVIDYYRKTKSHHNRSKARV